MKDTSYNMSTGKKVASTFFSAALAVAFVPGIAAVSPAPEAQAQTVATQAVKAKTYKITYELNGGVNNENNVAKVEKGKSAKLYAPTREGYVFEGWYADKAFTRKITKVKGVKKASKRVAYAKWAELTIDVSKAARGPESITTTLEEANSSTVFSPTNSDVRVEKYGSITYKTIKSGRDRQNLTVDILQPSTATASTPAPLVVFIQGGGFSGSSTTGSLDQRMAFAKAGYVVASVKHRVIPNAKWPAALQDCKSAVRFLKANAGLYGINKNQVAVAGNSSGGYFATMVGVTGNTKTITYDGAEVALDVDNNLDESSAVNAVIDLYGVSDLTIIGAGLDPALEEGHHSAATTEAILLNGAAAAAKGKSVFDVPEKAAAASPFSYIDSNDPPVMILHGDKDTLVSPVASYELYKRLTAAGVSAERYTVAGAGHGGALFNSDKALSMMTEFLNENATKDIVESEGVFDTTKAATGQDSISSTMAEATSQNVVELEQGITVTETKEVTYKTVNGTDLKMDILSPSNANGKSIMLINGGGFTRSDPSGSMNMRYAFARAGITVFSIQHRTVPQATMPAPLQDCKAAVRWIKANADTYHIDKNQIYAMGTSSGGYFASMVGVTGNTTKYDDQYLFDVGDNLDQSSAVAGVIDFYGVSDLTIIGARLSNEDVHDSESNTEALLVNGTAFGTNKGGSIFSNMDKAAIFSPFTYVDSSDPSFFMMHGTDDVSVSPVATKELQKVLEADGISATRYSIPGAGHGGWQFNQSTTYDLVIDYVNGK